MPPLKPPPTVWEKAALDEDLTLRLPSGVPMFFRRIPAGTFRMGSRGEHEGEEPVHEVEVPHGFFLGTFVVTQEQYRAVASRCSALKKQADPSHFKGDLRPVEQVSWEDATAFCRWLAGWEGLAREISEVRLPTEAEWEYACRGGSETEYYHGDGEAALAGVGWYAENSGNQTHAVDERAEFHPLGLYGMHGNVWEWCGDVYDRQAYRNRADGWVGRAWTLDDAAADADYWDDEDRSRGYADRVLRGGSWVHSAGYCRSAFRFVCGPDVRSWIFGFRVCLVRGLGGQTDSKAEPAAGDEGRGTRPESAKADFPSQAR